MLTGYGEKQLDFYQIDKEILGSFGINSEYQFSALLEKLNSGFAD